jgi:hypothetical protein
MPFVACAMLAWALYGTPVPGKITGGHRATSGKHGSAATIYFAYESDGPRTGSDKVDDSTYARFIKDNKPEATTPQTVTVRHLKIGPFHIAGVDALESAWSSVGFFFIFAAFWDLILTPFAYIIWIRPLLQRRLCKSGIETPGTVTALEKVSGKSTRYIVKYSYTDPAGTAHTSQMDTTSDPWHAASQGQATVILVSPKNFKRSMAYEFCPYKVLDGQFSNPYAQ